MGLGPMTGRAAGYCVGYGAPGFMNPFGRAAMPWQSGGYSVPPASPYAVTTPYQGVPTYGPAGFYGAGYPAWGAGFGYRPRLGMGFGRAWFGRGRRFWW